RSRPGQDIDTLTGWTAENRSGEHTRGDQARDLDLPRALLAAVRQAAGLVAVDDDLAALTTGTAFNLTATGERHPGTAGCLVAQHHPGAALDELVPASGLENGLPSHAPLRGPGVDARIQVNLRGAPH